MDDETIKEELERQLQALRGEVTELRSEQAMHKQTQEGLKAIELQLAGIIHSAMDGIITINEQQHIVLFNSAAEKMFRCSAQDVIGKPIDQFIPEKSREAHRNHIQTFGQKKITSRRMGALGSVNGLRANGEEFQMEASISQVGSGRKKMFTVILRDISERIRIEEQLRKTERLAELGTLASGMAHEIGTPMNVILGRAELLMRKAPEESTKNGLETIVTQVERITKIMNQLLSFARKRAIERRHTDLTVVIANVLDVLQERIKKYAIQVETSFDPETPKVFADPDQMSQVLLNLVLNACPSYA